MNFLFNIRRKHICHLMVLGVALSACNQDPSLQVPDPVNESARIGWSPTFKACASLIAETLEEPQAIQEVYQRVLLGYEGHSAIPLTFLLGGTLPNAKPGKFKDKAQAALFGQKLRQKNGVGGLIQTMIDSEVELYWPYWQEWDGNELPTISFTPETGTIESIGYKLVLKNGKYKLEQVQVDDDYAFAHPTWILRKHTPLDSKSRLSGRFLPNFMQGPKLGFATIQTVGGDKANDEQLPQEPDYGDYDPGYYYGSGAGSPGPGFVPGPTNGTADVNQIYVEHIRTNGTNFRDIFGGGDNDIIFHLGDQKYPAKGQTTIIQLSIDRWAGRRGVWRRPNAIWDEDWDALERDQFIGVETVNSGVTQERTIGGSVKILYKVTGGTVTKDEKDAITRGNEAGFEVTPISWSFKRTNTNEYLTNSKELNRRIFLAGNSGDIEQQGTLDGVAIRFAGNTRNSGVYYTLKLVPLNFANGF